MKNKKVMAGLGAAAGVLALSAVSSGTAQADTNVGNTGTFVAVGSDTSQDVVEGLSNTLKINGQPVISNYLSTPVGRSITTRTGNPNCTFVAPKNSGEGRDALSAAMRSASFNGSSNLAGCVDVARSSSGGAPTTSPGSGAMTYVPFATDSVTYAALPAGDVPHALTLNDLKAIYTTNTGDGCIFAPLLPSKGSGTRSFFATLLGITNDNIAGTAGSWGTCVKDTLSGTPVQEHDGRFISKPDQIVPLSTAQAIAQGSGVIQDLRGAATLGSIDFQSALGAEPVNLISPVALQPAFGTATRPLYNVVSTQALNTNANLAATFKGAGSLVCTAGAGTIRKYGLEPLATSGSGILCGDTSKTNP